MAKKKQLPDEEVVGGPVDSAPGPTDTQPENKKAGKKAFQGSTGYNYGSDYNFQGGRPPSKTDYDAMSQEQRNQIGLPEFSDWKKAAIGWRSGFHEGGGNYQNQQNIGDALRSSGAQSWDQIAGVLAKMGIVNSKDEGQALYRRLQGAFQGNIDPSGRYHRGEGGQWADVGTSDLARRGVAGAADYSGNMSGIQAVLAGLAGGSGQGAEQGYFDRLVSQGDWTEWPPGSGKFFNDPGNDASKRVWVDRNNLQVEGSGYKSTTDPSQGPTVDYSKVGSGKISDYLSGQGAQSASMDDYWNRAAQAQPIVPGVSATPTETGGANNAPATAGSSGTNFWQTSPSTGAWGVPNQGPNQQPNQPINQQPNQNYNQPQHPNNTGFNGTFTPQVGYNMQPNQGMGGHVNNGMNPFGQARRPRNIWGIN